MSIPPAVTALLAGELVSDGDLDHALFPPGLRGEISMVHWSPLDVSLRAAALLANGGGKRILDIGSGVGKFCILGALTTRAEFVGVEQRAGLVEAARVAAARSGAARAFFVHANVVDVDFRQFDGFYLYNPFYEQVSLDVPPIDETIEPSPECFWKYVATTIRKLREMRRGTRVVTYNGFGGDMPFEYDRVPLVHQFWRDFGLWIRR